jgi:pyruvate dehydrogenase E2 component (dihydrolipoamide acetyltransferase)
MKEAHMAKFEFKLPDIGEGVTEGEVVNWLVAVGDTVTEDQDIVEVMTDKATVTIGAPKAGKVAELRGQAGDMIPVGDVLVVLDVAGDATSAAVEEQPARSAAPTGDTTGGPVGDIKDELPGTTPRAQPPEPAREAPASGHFVEKPLAAPATRRLARELGVDLRRVPPSGKAGRVTPDDVRAFVGAATAAPAPRQGEPPAPPPAPVPAGAEEERIPIRGVRKRIFENMARSKHTAAHFHYVEECNVTALMGLRERTRGFAAEEGVKLTYLPFVIKAVVASLKRHPELNSLVDDASLEIVRRHNFDIGIAVATDAGLIVPVVRDADRLSVLELAREIDRLADAARAGKAQPADLGGSSFTVTSLGKMGGFVAPPIINYPEVGIMGVHSIKKRPVVQGDEIVIGNVMMLSWSFDHRLIDGHVAAAFAQDIVSMLEDPDRLLVTMR